MATHTFTIDTASSPWVYPDGRSTTVSGVAETFTLEFEDTGAGGKLKGIGNSSITLADGNTLYIESDRNFTEIWHEADGAVANSGSIWVYVNDTARVECKVVTATLTDADATGANNLANITFEYPGKPYQWSWVNVNTA